ncbi:MAG TPA: hypothetical protein DCG75_17950 [Bacteroidales bacterium]|nr:hypothetical protein [Bacteroidales bacterium]
MRKLLYAFFVLSFLFYSCEEETNSFKVVIEGIVMDAETSERLNDVTVELYTKSKSHITTTNENGYYNLGEFNVGDYNIVYSKEGYLNDSKSLNLSSEIIVTGVGYEIVNSDLIYLTPLNEKAEFTVYRKYLDGEEIAAANFPYTVYLGSFNDPIVGTTSANGIISLDNVPSEISLSIDHEQNGIQYKTYTTIDTKDDNKVVVYGYNPEADLGVVSTNVLDTDGQPIEDFAVTDNITILFTIPVDIDNANFDLLEDGWMSVDFTYQWLNNNMTLTIDPVDPLLSNYYYSLEIDVKNENNTQTFSKVYNFTTE